MSHSIEPNGPDGPTGIVVEVTVYINARSLPWSEPTISFEQVIEQWNRLDPERYVQGELPGINWKIEGTESRGIIYKGESVPAIEGLSFTIDDSYLA